LEPEMGKKEFNVFLLEMTSALLNKLLLKLSIENLGTIIS
jgi:hypothetical protein